MEKRGLNIFVLPGFAVLIFAIFFSARPASIKKVINGKTERLEEIIIVYKSHFDIGYTHLASEAVRDYQTSMIDKALIVVEKNKNLSPDQQFVWTIPGWPMKKILEDWDGQTPARQNRIIHGPMCDPDGVRMTMETVPKIFTAEALGTLLKTWNINTEDAKQAIAGSYENSILYYEHTWGGAMYWIAKYLPVKNGMGQVDNWDYGNKWKADLKTNRFNRLVSSWEEHTDYARNANTIILPVLNDNMQRLAKAVNFKGPRTVVYNPLPWKRNAVVNGTIVKNIPAGGYTTTTPVTAKKNIKAEKTTLENSIFKIEVDPMRGTIRSIVDKRTGKELVDSTSQYGFGQFLYERFSANEIADYTRAYVKIKDDWFNNQWSTNYRLWNGGKWSYRFRIWSYDKYDSATSLIKPSLEARYPVEIANVDTTAGKLPMEQPGVSVSRQGVMVTAFGQNPDGEGTILRVWEQAGNGGNLTVSFPAWSKYTTATPVNLRGETKGIPLNINNGKLLIDLTAYAPASYILN